MTALKVHCVFLLQRRLVVTVIVLQVLRCLLLQASRTATEQGLAGETAAEGSLVRILSAKFLTPSFVLGHERCDVMLALFVIILPLFALLDLLLFADCERPLELYALLIGLHLDFNFDNPIFALETPL